ncbi:HEAT repeat domain-containing protein [Nocardia xishanensis]|uniref:HEAT repeat domain-containing protein n=1 Tax=Nocardia xishanensis TaxID=238964 RepID=UPI000A01C10A|nr:HEAT repeat domain-containing protein [Nocardia xishanensis]
MERNRISEDVRSAQWDVRRDAARTLGGVLPDTAALSDLTALLDDEDTAVQQEAAESLVRYGDRVGLIVVLTELGRRSEDPDSDYIAYRLRELQIFERLPILEAARTIAGELTPEAHAGLEQLEALFGDVVGG